MPLGIGLPEILIILVIVLVIFGPKRLPDLGRSLGSGMREFKDSVTGKGGDDAKLPAGDEQPEPVRSEKSEATPAGGHGS
jgi:sec-independent protein translocase protein TatA